MKQFILLLLVFCVQSVFANPHITCSNGEYTVSMDVDTLKTFPVSTGYQVFKHEKLVKTGVFQKLFEGYDDETSAYYWIFENQTNDVIGIGTQDFKVPASGMWTGSADVSIDTPAGLFNDSTIPCEIEVD